MKMSNTEKNKIELMKQLAKSRNKYSCPFDDLNIIFAYGKSHNRQATINVMLYVLRLETALAKTALTEIGLINF